MFKKFIKTQVILALLLGVTSASYANAAVPTLQCPTGASLAAAIGTVHSTASDGSVYIFDFPRAISSGKDHKNIQLWRVKLALDTMACHFSSAQGGIRVVNRTGKFNTADHTDGWTCVENRCNCFGKTVPLSSSINN